MYRFFILPMLTLCLFVSITHSQNINLSNQKVQSPPGLLNNFLKNNPRGLLTPPPFVPILALIDTNLKISWSYDNNGNKLTELHQAYSNNTWGTFIDIHLPMIIIVI